MKIINIIIENTHSYLTLLRDELEDKYPNRTENFYKCVRDMKFVLEAYCLDLAEDSNRHVHMIVSQFYRGNKLQLHSVDVELWAHKRLVDLICLDETVSGEEKTQLKKLFYVIRDAFDIGTYKDSYDYLDKLVYNRISYSKFSSTPVDSVKTEIILNAANGLTPALAHNYHYRVDVVPDSLKQKVWPLMHSFHDWSKRGLKEDFLINYNTKTSDEWRDLGVCFNWQFQAPLILCYSLPIPNNFRLMWDGPKRFATSREATTIGLGLNLWNVIMKVESLGLNSCLCKAYTQEATEAICLTTTEDMGENRWTPLIFLCIGTGVIPKGDHREYKPMNIVNTLKFVE
jgi:hypothetical protein